MPATHTTHRHLHTCHCFRILSRSVSIPERKVLMNKHNSLIDSKTWSCFMLLLQTSALKPWDRYSLSADRLCHCYHNSTANIYASTQTYAIHNHYTCTSTTKLYYYIDWGHNLIYRPVPFRVSHDLNKGSLLTNCHYFCLSHQVHKEISAQSYL